jgi:hypothetical protein
MANNLLAQAIAQLDLRETYTISPGGEPVDDLYSNPASLINVILPNLFVIVGVLLFLFIFLAGFKMVTNPDDKSVKDQGKKTITYAIIGFLLLFASYWIAQIIEFYTGVTIVGN